MTVKTDDTEEQVTEETEATERKEKQNKQKKQRGQTVERHWRLNKMTGIKMAINCIAIKVPPQRKELLLDITNMMISTTYKES